MRLNLRKQEGFTLIEVTIILLVLVILSTIMLPQLGNFNRLARFVKVKEDLGAICATAKKMLDEVMLGTFYQTPNGNDHQIPAASPVGLLVGPGALPAQGSEGDGDAANITGDGWRESTVPANDCLTIAPDVGVGSIAFDCDFMENHFQRNNPFGTSPTTAAGRYKNAFDGTNGGTQNPGLQNTLVGGWGGWRGPYFDAITPDPWGNRYAINSHALFANPAATHTTAGPTIFSSAVVCYSTGPDLGVDTNMNQPQNLGAGWVTGGDDLAVILSAYGPF